MNNQKSREFQESAGGGSSFQSKTTAQRRAALRAKLEKERKKKVVKESIWNTYRSMAHIISEVEDPKHWRSWPLDPKKPEKGRLAAQKASSQSKHGHGGNEGFLRLSARKRRVRVTTPASKKFAGAKGKVVRHTTAQRGRDAWVRGPLDAPSAIEKRTDVTANVTPGKPGGQRKIKNFPDKHSTDTKDPQAPKRSKA
jgi:hypothetical protein